MPTVSLWFPSFGCLKECHHATADPVYPPVPQGVSASNLLSLLCWGWPWLEEHPSRDTFWRNIIGEIALGRCPTPVLLENHWLYMFLNEEVHDRLIDLTSRRVSWSQKPDFIVLVFKSIPSLNHVYLKQRVFTCGLALIWGHLQVSCYLASAPSGMSEVNSKNYLLSSPAVCEGVPPPTH